MAIEARRACGFRKVGGLYLCGSGAGMPCCKLPIMLDVCPTCGHGVRQTRGWTWIDPRPWLRNNCTQAGGRMLPCPVENPDQMGERVGLLWIGTAFYRTPAAFIEEGAALGISRRIVAIPRGFKLGESWIFFAHPHVKQTIDADGKGTWHAGVFRIFKPDRIEKIVTRSESRDADAMEKLAKAGITPIVVPDDDKDHRGSVYDRDLEQPPLPINGADAEHMGAPAQ